MNRTKLWSDDVDELIANPGLIPGREVKLVYGVTTYRDRKGKLRLAMASNVRARTLADLPDEALLSAEMAARLLKVTVQTIRRRCQHKQIKIALRGPRRMILIRRGSLREQGRTAR